jgi:hypothetical protein
MKRRGRNQRNEVGDLGERSGRLPDRDVDLAAHAGEAELVRGPQRQTVLPGEQLLHVEAIASVGGNAAGGGVGVREEALLLEAGELRAHGGGAPVDVRPIGERARADWAPVIDVALDNPSQDLALAFAQHRADDRNVRGWPARPRRS